MPNDKHPAPSEYHGVMVSSTFTDLEQHRTVLIKAIKDQGLTDLAMENDSAKPDVDVIDSSRQMVQDASACIGVISRKYGQTPLCPVRNLGELSITELEFNEAQRLERPIRLFIMGDISGRFATADGAQSSRSVWRCAGFIGVFQVSLWATDSEMQFGNCSGSTGLRPGTLKNQPP